jgi:hypothetical protein
VRCRLPASVCGFLVCLECRSRARVCVLGCTGFSLSCWSAGFFCAVGFFAGVSLPGFCGGWRGEKRVTNPQQRHTTTSPMTWFNLKACWLKVRCIALQGRPSASETSWLRSSPLAFSKPYSTHIPSYLRRICDDTHQKLLSPFYTEGKHT